MADTTFAIIHITDTHIGCDPGYTHRGLKPYECALRLVEEIRKIPFQIDAIIHTGDVCGDKDVHSTVPHYELAAKILSALPQPIYFLAGNHDRADLMFDILPMARVNWATDSEIKYSYAFDFKGETFIALDTVRYEETQGHAPEKLFGWLEAQLETAKNGVTVLLHGPPIKIDSPWMDRNMLIDNGEQLHQLLARYSPKLSAVLFGHIHQPFSLRRDGVPYHCASASFLQFAIGPADENIQVEPEGHAGFSIVRYGPGGVLLQRRVIP